MKKMFSILVLFSLLLVNSSVIGTNLEADEINSFFSNEETLTPKIKENVHSIGTQVEYPWMLQQSDFLEWYIRIVYNGESFLKEVPIDTTDFKDKFLKHPEYGEIIRFNVDNDPEDDVEVTVGCYWSIIRDENGNDVKSLEKRTQVRLLQSGNYISDADGSFELWSELHVNYGLIKNSALSQSSNRNSLLHSILSEFSRFTLLTKILSTIFSKFEYVDEEHQIEPIVADDSDSISLGSGYRSPSGESIPRYIEKRFAFARESLFSPTIYQQIIDPGSSKGISSLDILYGYQAYKAQSQEPSYDIGFAIGYDPAVYVKTKFVPRNGYIYYFFNDDSSRSDETVVSFIADLNEGSGESSSLSLLFERIDSSLAYDGRWMCFDVNITGDNEPLGGSLLYLGSHQFTIDILIDTPLFAEKIKFEELPTLLDISWDFDFNLAFTPYVYVNARGEFDIDMDKQIGCISVFYPVIDQISEECIFLRIPQGLPRSTHVEAEAALQIDINNLQSSSNYVRGHLSHECSEMVKEIEAFLPEIDLGIPIDSGDEPIVRITDIPARSGFDGTLYWNKLQGSILLTRNSDGPPDPIDLQLSFGNYSIQDTLQLRNGYAQTGFRLAESGYFSLDTSDEILSNNLILENDVTGNGIELAVEAVSADDFRVDWNLGGGLEELSFDDIKFKGLIDRIKNLVLNLHYQGKSTEFTLDWDLGEEGTFLIAVEQEEDLVIDFSDFGLNSSMIYLDGGLTISNLIQLDMSWKWKQGEGSDSGAVDPGYFSINKFNDESILKNVDFEFIYMESYGVRLTLSDLQFYLDFEWWKGDRLLPYVWLDYEVSATEFDVDLLWKNANGETQWYENVEEW